MPLERTDKQPILLTHWRAPGDTICATSVVRDLALSYPDRFEIHIAGACGAIWENNPHIAHFWGAEFPAGMPRMELTLENPQAEATRIQFHYLTSFHRRLSAQLGLNLELLKPYGDLHLTEIEKSHVPVDDPYWVVVAGGKTSNRAKLWPTRYWQNLVDQMATQGIQVVQIGAQLPGHTHPRLSGVVDLVGQTTLREALVVISNASGVICPVTFAMHAAAAFQKPCIVIAGGREPWWWEAYTNSPGGHFGKKCEPVRVPHHFLHTIGRLNCCEKDGCWKTNVSPDNDHDTRKCTNLSPECLTERVPQCMALLSPHFVSKVVSEVKSTL
ncbi:glycosyltransferase family 9 protein [Planctopirus hydrillae]|uniref:ADP-heptose--LPS heptosyltransferase n=1 Tax=Planctopirus hydrillae TaxID=1841610 RepID=A0A1C3EFY7_9PLAN|nr:glycosyltransferase family 9 protein [Planctopirus hydrillae]ODA32129.1 hypothetical protein A6X21_21700 [Planctopirus hydrillae]